MNTRFIIFCISISLSVAAFCQNVNGNSFQGKQVYFNGKQMFIKAANIKTNDIRIGFGRAYTSLKDMHGFQTMIGIQQVFRNRHMLDIRFDGFYTSKSVNITEEFISNVNQYTFSILNTFEYGYIFRISDFSIYPSAGITFGYGREQIYNEWRERKEVSLKTFRGGIVSSMNFEYRFSQNYTIGANIFFKKLIHHSTLNYGLTLKRRLTTGKRE